MEPGSVLLYHPDKSIDGACPAVIASVATKDHWRDPSRLEWIERGLADLHSRFIRSGFTLALPALGCGLGGLDFDSVRGAVEAEFTDPLDYIMLYRPS